MEYDPGRAVQDVPVISLVQVIVKSDDSTLLLVGPIPLNHLPAEGKPGSAIRLHETSPVVAMDVRGDDQTSTIVSECSIFGIFYDSKRPKPPL